MPTTVVKSIGSAGGRDYSTMQAWEDASPANLVTADEIWQGECYNDSEFQPNSGTALTISGETTDATRYLVLKCASGQSFRDNANVRTNALLYNQANGVALLQSYFPYNIIVNVTTDYTIIDGIQFKGATHSTSGISISNVGCVFKNCIVAAGPQAQFTGIGMTGGATDTIKVLNCLFQGGTNGFSFNSYSGVHPRIEFCTCIADQAGGYAFLISNSSQPIIKNCAAFGYAHFYGAGFNAGTPDASSDYNATDLSTASGGAHDLTSLTFASQFVNSTNDWRAVGTGSLQAGTPDTSYVTDDISAMTRSVTTPTIGAWELASAGPARFNRLPTQAVNRATTY